VEPFLEENKKLYQQNEDDDKRRLMMKDKLELARQLNLSKMVRQVTNDLDKYKPNKDQQDEKVEQS